MLNRFIFYEVILWYMILFQETARVDRPRFGILVAICDGSGWEDDVYFKMYLL